MAETITIRTATSTDVVTVVEAGPQGATGQGVPTGGSALQVLRKVSATNYDTEWAAAGSGSGSVTSVALAGTGLSISGSPVTTSGTITASVSYGTTAGTACQGNDARLSDTRTPSSTLAHASSHASAGSDPLAPSDIGAQGIFAYANTTITGNTTLIAARAKIYDFSATSGTPFDVTLPTAGNQVGDIIVARNGFIASTSALTFKLQNGTVRGELGLVELRIFRWVNQDGSANGWFQEGVELHQQNLADSSAVSGILPVGNLPTGTTSTTVALGDHVHGNITNAGLVGTTSGLPLKTGTGGIVEAGAFGTSAGQFSEGNHTHSASAITSGTFDNARVNFAAPAAIGNTTPAAGTFTTLSASTSLTLGTSGILSGGTNTIEQRNTTSGQTFRIYNTVSGAADANYERGFMRWNTNVLQIGTEKLGTGSARALEFQTDGTTRLTLSTSGGVATSGLLTAGDNFQVPASKLIFWQNRGVLSSSADGIIVLGNQAGTSFDRLMFGGTTSSFPALKRSTTTLQVRLADDSAYSVIDAQHRLQGTAPASATATGTAGDIRYDGSYVYICSATNTWVRAALGTW